MVGDDVTHHVQPLAAAQPVNVRHILRLLAIQQRGNLVRKNVLLRVEQTQRGMIPRRADPGWHIVDELQIQGNIAMQHCATNRIRASVQSCSW